MKQAMQILFNKIFKPTCPICFRQYEHDNLPTIMCPNQHTCCEECMKFYANSKLGCYVVACSKDMYSVKRPNIETFKNSLKYHQQVMLIFQSQQEYYLSKINLTQQSQEKAIQIFLRAEQQFLKQNFIQALSLCKQSIRSKPNEWPNFKFLGHPRQFWLCNSLAYVSCYQNHMKNCKQRSVYDLLNLCLALTSKFKENQQWLLQQFHKRIVIKQLAMGLGILYYAHGRDERGEYFFELTCKFSFGYTVFRFQQRIASPCCLRSYFAKVDNFHEIHELFKKQMNTELS